MPRFPEAHDDHHDAPAFVHAPSAPYASEVIVKAGAAQQRGGFGQEASARVHERINAVVLGLVGALAAMVEALPQPVRRAADLERALGLQPPLAWRIFRVSQAPDAAEAVEYLPTIKQMQRVVAKASKEVPAPVATRAQAALDEFIAVVNDVGGDQRGFESLASGLLSARVRRVEIDHRRWAFRGNTHIWGVQCRCLVACALERPGMPAGTREGIMIRGVLDLQTHRPESALVLRVRSHLAGAKAPAPPGEGQEAPAPAQRHDDGSVPAREWRGELKLLPPLGGSKPPLLTTTQGEGGWQETQVRVPGVGRSEAVSFFMSQAYRGAEDDRCPGLGMLVEVPAEMLLLEYIVPRGRLDPALGRVRSFANAHDVLKAYLMRREDEIPIHEHVQHFPNARSVPAIAQVPGWPDVVRHVLGEEEWGLEAFDVYRCAIAFPMLHAYIGLMFDTSARE